MAGSYLTTSEAMARLGKYGIQEAGIHEGDLELASDAVDGAGPFVGYRYSDEQERMFPRSETAPGDTEGEVPGRILDAVALMAYSETEEGGDVAVKSESVLDHSITYDRPAVSQSRRRIFPLLAPYRRVSGRRL